MIHGFVTQETVFLDTRGRCLWTLNKCAKQRAVVALLPSWDFCPVTCVLQTTDCQLSLCRAISQEHLRGRQTRESGRGPEPHVRRAVWGQSCRRGTGSAAQTPAAPAEGRGGCSCSCWQQDAPEDHTAGLELPDPLPGGSSSSCRSIWGENGTSLLPAT